MKDTRKKGTKSKKTISERKDNKKTKREKERLLRAVAYHEAGHAVMAHFLGKKIDFVTIDASRLDLDGKLGSVDFKPDYVEKDGCIYLDNKIFCDLDDNRIFPSKRCLDSQILLNDIKIGIAGNAAMNKIFPNMGLSSEEDMIANGQFRDSVLESINGKYRLEGEAYRFYAAYMKNCFKEIEADISRYWNEIVLLANTLLERKMLNGTEVAELLSKFGHTPIPLEVQMQEWNNFEKEHNFF